MRVSVANHLGEDAGHLALRRDVYSGLQKTPKSLPPKWFYDTVGSELFDQITRLPEYYPTRAEAEILRARSAEVASACRADTLVELGSGTSEKTRMLLDALRHRGSLRRFVPFDVDASVLSATATAIQREYSGVEINAVCGDFEEHLTEIPRGGRRLFVFLGSTIGNLTPGPRAQFLTALAGVMRPGDSLLLGTDLVKDAARLVRAYDDPGGVTAQLCSPATGGRAARHRSASESPAGLFAPLLLIASSCIVAGAAHLAASDRPKSPASSVHHRMRCSPAAARVGFSVALGEHLACGPQAIRARLAELGDIARTVLADVSGWRVVEAVDEPSAITTLAPIDGADPAAVRAWLLSQRRIVTTYAGVERAPLELPAPVLRISPHVDNTADDLDAFAEALVAATAATSGER